MRNLRDAIRELRGVLGDLTEWFMDHPDPLAALAEAHEDVVPHGDFAAFAYNLGVIIGAAEALDETPASVVDTIGCCCYAHHEGPCCPGWAHFHDPHEIERCDECRRYDNDDQAIEAHRRECGCDWPERAAR